MAYMRYLCLFLLLLTSANSARSADSSLKEARQRWLHGNYEEARSLYEDLAKNAATRDEAAVGLSHTWQSQGEYDKALAVVDDALKASPKNADLHARRAELLYQRGRWDDADKAAALALE